VGLPRSSFYYQPHPNEEENAFLRRRIDQIYTADPTYGSPRITATLQREGLLVNHKRVERLMRLMGLMAIYPKKKTSLPNPAHKVYPYLLGQIKIERVNQVWSTDITYIPTLRGFVYLCAVMDWYSRYVLCWSVSTTMDTAFCLEALEGALQLGRPRSSTPIRAASLPALSSPPGCCNRASPSAWMGVDAPSTISLSSVFGGRSNTRRSTSKDTMAHEMRKSASRPICATMTITGYTRRWVTLLRASFTRRAEVCLWIDNVCLL